MRESFPGPAAAAAIMALHGDCFDSFIPNTSRISNLLRERSLLPCGGCRARASGRAASTGCMAGLRRWATGGRRRAPLRPAPGRRCHRLRPHPRADHRCSPSRAGRAGHRILQRRCLALAPGELPRRRCRRRHDEPPSMKTAGGAQAQLCPQRPPCGPGGQPPRPARASVRAAVRAAWSIRRSGRTRRSTLPRWSSRPATGWWRSRRAAAT